MKSITVDKYNTASLIELAGIPYFTTYTFQGIYANDVNLGKIDDHN